MQKPEWKMSLSKWACIIRRYSDMRIVLLGSGGLFQILIGSSINVASNWSEPTAKIKGKMISKPMAGFEAMSAL